jgi:hypothetical protein
MDKYVVMIDGELHTYTDYNDIPEQFDHLIEFAPEYPPAPHTPEQHEWLETLNTKLQELMTREKGHASSN